MPTFTQIGSAVVVGSGGAANINFASIPSTYTDLVLKYSIRSSGAGSVGIVLALAFNGSTSNFSNRYLEGDGSSTGSFTSPANFGGVSTTTTMTASTFSSGEIYIPNYAGSTNKSYSIDSVTEQNATGALAELIAGLWSQTTAINQITLSTSGTLQEHSTAYLYGVSNA
jgi:hypothetical protein